MDGVTFAFIVLPCLGAVITGYLLTDWRLAGALASGGLACLLVLPGTGPFTAYVLPPLGGAAVGALALLPVLRFRSDTTVWGRMTVALVAAFAAAYANLIIIAGTS